MEDFNLLVFGTVCTVLAIVSFILALIGFYFLWKLWVCIGLSLMSFVLAAEAIYLFRKDQQRDKYIKDRYSNR